MASSYLVFQVNCCLQKPSISHHFDPFKTLPSSVKLFLGELQQLAMQIDVSKTIKNTSVKFLDAFVDHVFEFIDQPLLPNQSNFAPVDELRASAVITSIEGEIPDDFPEGVYIRNGSSLNLVTLCFDVNMQLNKIKKLRFGKINKYISNTNVFEHSGKFYSIAENHMPQEINIFTLETLGNWNVTGTWNRPFTSHPKKAPGTGELVIMGVDATRPFVELGVISADGNKLLHKVDLKLNRCSLCHEIGVTQRYNVFLDYPLSIDINRLVLGGPLIKYENEGYAKIGIMPRYGDADSIKWFDVEPNCTFHILNCFEDGDQVVVWGCRALESIIPGPELGVDKFEWFSRKFRHVKSVEENFDARIDDKLLFSCAYEWRLNMQTGEVKERNLTGTEFSMDFPMINGDYTGTKNKYGYTQIVDSNASSASGMLKYGGLAKLYFEEPDMEFLTIETQSEKPIKVEYHRFEDSVFCTGAAFFSKGRGLEEDDGWIITFAHNENTNTSQVSQFFCCTVFFCVIIYNGILQKNFAPVEEIGGLVEVACIEGQIPADFPEGVYFRNGVYVNLPIITKLERSCSFWGPNGYLSNTLIFEHSGKLYAIAENYLPQEVDISTLETRDEWNVNGAWNRPFTSHPKVLCSLLLFPSYSDSTMHFTYFATCFLISYNIIMDSPLTVDAKRLLVGGLLVKYQKEGYARIGPVKPSYQALIGVKTSSSGSQEDLSLQMLPKQILIVPYRTVDFPMINEKYTGLKHKYGYTQVVDSVASSSAGFPKYHGLAKLYLDEPHPEPSQNGGENNHLTEVESHKFAENNFCSGAAFAAKPGGSEWLACLFNEETNVGQVHIIDAKKVDSEAVAKITQPQRVPYGFHGTFVPMPQSSKFIALLG
ncbi:hypothetical protein JRO89_XS03G0272600 [Xanthoceras sorbifolium]|uniref:Uncharacterized protein n=1 Tax=Xanthoceras sorbifolium TaxID=99658 RepID=A0ABQ8ICB1_9ROSI|nr:hypothetical protein JRO89_XS03G0272600 [Xanthoceras sorbifolium]